MSLTEIRSAARDLLAAALPEEVDIQVAIGPEKYEDPMKHLLVQIVVGSNSPETQALLDEMLEEAGERSVRATLEADPDLGGCIAELIVQSTTGFRTYQTPSGPLIGAEWTVGYIAA